MVELPPVLAIVPNSFAMVQERLAVAAPLFHLSKLCGCDADSLLFCRGMLS